MSLEQLIEELTGNDPDRDDIQEFLWEQHEEHKQKSRLLKLAFEEISRMKGQLEFSGEELDRHSEWIHNIDVHTDVDVREYEPEERGDEQ